MTKPWAPAVLFALGLAGALGGCAGFTPLYGAPGVTPKLAAIRVQRPDGRLGYLMGQDLDDSFGKNRDQAPIYQLNYANHEVRVPRGITIANVASRYEVDVTSQYTLTEIATHKVVTAGRVSANVTYDVVTQPYDEIQAVEDGERRVAEQVAERIRIELASYFAAPRPIAPNVKADLAAAADPSAFSVDHSAAVIQSPREKALGEPAPRNDPDLFGQPAQVTATPDQPKAFSPSEDPNNPKPADPGAIITLPDPAAGQ